MPARNAFTSCQACRRFKRKCSRDLPACALCTRLRRFCDYGTEKIYTSDASTISTVSRQGKVCDRRSGWKSQSLSASTDSSGNGGVLFNASFPLSFILDPANFQPLVQNTFNLRGPSSLEQAAVRVRDVQQSVVDNYVAMTYAWLPMLSIKRLRQAMRAGFSNEDPCFGLLLLCMNLVGQGRASSPDNEDYLLARQAAFQAEGGGFITLRLLQSLVFLGLYELGQAVHPAAYLTIGRAARLGAMMGYHNPHQDLQLFSECDTWTFSEEQRRTWWAIFMLDKMVVCGSPDLLTAAPEPGDATLLPCDDLSFTQGKVGFSVALLTKGFHPNTSIGPFAKVCQAVHMLSKVLRHYAARKTPADTTVLSEEGMGLHRALMALEAILASSEFDNRDGDGNLWQGLMDTAVAVCSLARFLLYNEYACNVPSQALSMCRVPLEEELQKVSLEGVKTVASQTVAQLANRIITETEEANAAKRPISHSPLLLSCLYHAATKQVWFIKEEEDAECMVSALQSIMRALRVLQVEWNAAGKYLELLHADGSAASVLADRTLS